MLTFKHMRRHCAAAVVVVLVAMTSQQVRADQPPKAAEVLDRHVKATGGKKVHQMMKTRTMKGTVRAKMGPHPAVEASVVVHAKAPHGFHMEIDSPGVLNVQRVVNGKVAWEVRDGAEARALSGPELAEAVQLGFFQAAADWRKIYQRVETIGSAVIEGRPAWEVQVSPRGGEQFTQFYDRESGRLVKYVRTVERYGLSKFRIEVLLNDYRAFEGVWVATEIKQKLVGIPEVGDGSQVWRYTDIRHNTEVPNHLFEIPESVKKQAGAKSAAK